MISNFVRRHYSFQIECIKVYVTWVLAVKIIDVIASFDAL